MKSGVVGVGGGSFFGLLGVLGPGPALTAAVLDGAAKLCVNVPQKSITRAAKNIFFIVACRSFLDCTLSTAR